MRFEQMQLGSNRCCQHCGQQVDDGMQFCNYCGKPLNTNQQNYGTSKDRDWRSVKRGRTVLVAATLGVVVIAVIAGAVLASLNHSSAGDNASSPTEPPSSIPADGSKSDVGKKSSLKDATYGNLVTMGRFNQTLKKDAEDIEWFVLDVQGGHALLLSKMALDCRPISASLSYNYDITWEKSDIRKWLNEEFLNSFNELELASIDETTITQGNDGNTQDKVFLLSATEIGKYGGDGIATAQGTEYAQSRGVATYDTNTVNWWLRDYNPNRKTTDDDNHFMNVMYDGSTNRLGYLATEKSIGVRPAMWVSLDGKGTSAATTSGTEPATFGTITPDPKQDASLTNAGNSNPPSQNEKTDSTTSDTSATILTVIAADGKTLSGQVRNDEDGYVLGDSSSKEYTVEELKSLNLSDAELCIAWNEPFARQGYHFKNPGLQAYFEQRSWYEDRGNASSLSGVAAINNERLRQIAEGSTSARQWMSLSTS